jgi:hypothetical protein
MNIDTQVWMIGRKALPLLQHYASGRIAREELLTQLRELKIDECIIRHWEQLTTDPCLVPHWQVLQTIWGLIEEGEFQLREYGHASLWDDIKEIAFNLKRVTDIRGG